MYEFTECGSTKKIEIDIYTTLDSASYCGSCGSPLIQVDNEPKVESNKNPTKGALTDTSQDKTN